MWAYLSSLMTFLIFHLRCQNIIGHRKVMSPMKHQLAKPFSGQFQLRWAFFWFCVTWNLLGRMFSMFLRNCSLREERYRLKMNKGTRNRFLWKDSKLVYSLQIVCLEESNVGWPQRAQSGHRSQHSGWCWCLRTPPDSFSLCLNLLQDTLAYATALLNEKEQSGSSNGSESSPANENGERHLQQV